MTYRLQNLDECRYSRRLGSMANEGDYLKKPSISFDSRIDVDSKTHIYPSEIDDESLEFSPVPTPYWLLSSMSIVVVFIKMVF